MISEGVLLKCHSPGKVLYTLSALCSMCSRNQPGRSCHPQGQAKPIDGCDTRCKYQSILCFRCPASNIGDATKAGEEWEKDRNEATCKGLRRADYGSVRVLSVTKATKIRPSAQIRMIRTCRLSSLPEINVSTDHYSSIDPKLDISSPKFRSVKPSMYIGRVANERLSGVGTMFLPHRPP